MKTLSTLILSTLLVAATSVVAAAQTCEPGTYDRHLGECSIGAQAPTRAEMMNVIRAGSPSGIVATLEYGETVECPECFPLLQRAALENADAEVREVSAWWLRRRVFGFGAAMVQMKNVLATDASPVRRARAADALGIFHDPHGLDALRTAATSDADASVRAAAVRGIGELNISAGNDVIAAALGDRDITVRRAALSSVLEVNFFRQQDALLPLLGDADATVRRQTAQLLGEFRVDSAVTALAGMLRSDADVNARQAAAWALGRIGGAEAQGALAEVSATEASELVKSAINVARAMHR